MKSNRDLQQSLEELPLVCLGPAPQFFEAFVRLVKLALVEQFDCMLQVPLSLVYKDVGPVHIQNRM
jgi:hypothetical protein